MSSWDDESPVVIMNTTNKANASKLSSLFAQEESIAHTGNTGLAFQAKKAPKPQTQSINQSVNQTAPVSNAPSNQPINQSANPPSTAVIFACAANLIRYDSAGSPQMVGARACTILRNQSVNQSTGQPTAVYALVCYDPTNQKQECIATLSESFNLILSPPSYAMFYDDQRVYYCVQLTADQLDQLAKHVALTKHAQLAQVNQSTSIISQDLTAIIASDQPIRTGDQIKIKYTMSLTSATHPKGVGAVIGAVGSDDKPKPMRVGSKKELPGIEQGVIGMRKNSRRLLVIPPHLAYGAHGAGAVPANSVVVVDITVMKVKYAESNITPVVEPAAQPAPVAVTPVVAEASASQPSIIIQTIPQLSTPVVAAPSAIEAISQHVSQSVDSVDDGDEQRTMLAKKMSNLGFRMPGLPGALDPEHNAAQHNQAINQFHVQPPQNTRKDSFDSVDDSDAGSLHSTAVSPNPVVQHQPPQLTQPTQSIYQPVAQHPPQSHASAIVNQSVNQPISSTIPSSAAHTRVHSNTSLASMAANHHPSHHASYQPVSQHYYNQSSPTQGYHMHQSSPQAINQSISQPNYPHSFNSPDPYHMQSPASSSYMYQPNQPINQSINPAQLMNLEAKLDAIQTQLTQTSRSIGVSSTSLFDSPLTGVQLIKAVQSIINERDDARNRLTEQEKKCADLIAKVESNEERYERRFESYSEEIKMKNTQILELQANTRRLEQENQSMHAANRSINQSVDQHSVAKTELERQLKQLNDQLDEANTKVVSKDSELLALKQQLDHSINQSSTKSDDQARALASLQTQLDQQTADSERTINQLNQSLVQLEKERGLLQEEVEKQKNILRESQSINQSINQSVSELQSVIDGLRAELQKANSEHQTDRQSMIQSFNQAKIDEFERGRESALDEVRDAMSAMKEKARSAIESLDHAKSEAEERAETAESERDEIIENSRAYIEKLKSQMAAKLAEIEEEQSNQASPEIIGQTLKQLYGNLSRSLQEYGEHRWRAFEVAQLAKVEIAFILTGERSEFALSPADDESENETHSTQSEPSLAEEPIENENAVAEDQVLSTDESTNESTIEMYSEEIAEPAEVDEEPQQSLPDGEPDHALITTESDASLAEPLLDHSEESTLTVDSVSNVVIEDTDEQPPASSDESVAEAIDNDGIVADDVSQIELSVSSQSGADDGNVDEVTEHVDDVAMIDSSATESGESSSSSSFELVTSSSSSESTGQLNGEYVVVDTDKASDSIEENGQSVSHDAEGGADESSETTAPDTSDVNTAIDVEDTFEHPRDNHVIAASSHTAVVHPDTEPADDDASPVTDDEQRDHVAPLPVLTVDTSVLGNNYIVPPTPTLLTPPASTLRLTNNGEQSNDSSPKGTLISPTVLTSTPHAIIDPFDDEQVSMSSTSIQATKPAANATNKNAAKKNKLFDDDEEDSLFVAPAARPKPVAKVAAALFGDSDDDDDVLFRR